MIFEPAYRLSDANGEFSGIEGPSPYGHRTTATVHPDGYLATLVAPAGASSYSFEYNMPTNPGLLTQRTDARGTFDYLYDEATGRLQELQISGQTIKTLTRSEIESTVEVTRNTVMELLRCAPIVPPRCMNPVPFT